MKKKIKGSVAERELLDKFWDNEWVAIRVAGSGSTKYPSPDIIAGNGYRRFVIEVKYVNNTKKYFTAKEIKELKYFARKFGSEGLIAIKFQNINWFILSIEELRETERSYYADVNLVKNKGFLFEDFLKVMNT